MDNNFSVTIENLPKLQSAMRNFPGIAMPILQKALAAAQFIFQKNTLKGDPVPWRTGNLLQSFRFGLSPMQAKWGPTARYAPFVEFGTRPHEIRPVRASVLAWQSGGTSARYVTSASGRQYRKAGSPGSTVFARVVHHPGTRANPFMERIIEKSGGEINSMFGQAGDMITRELALAAS